MDDYFCTDATAVIDDTFMSGLKHVKRPEGEPMTFIVKIDDEHEGAFLGCVARVKPMCMQDVMFAALGLYLVNLYKDHYTTE